MLFFSNLPLRVDAVTLKHGDQITGKVMTVSTSQLAADSSLSLNDAKLVRVGAATEIEQQDLGIKVTGTVTKVADKPGTNKVDPTRVYFEVTPKDAPKKLVGASVRIAIAVQSTKGAVLAVPLSAISVGADGNSRVQVDRGVERGVYVAVIPGLASDGLVEVRPTKPGTLKAGDQVVVGVGGSIPAGSVSGSVAPTGTVPTSTTSAPSTSTAPTGTSAAATGTSTGSVP